MTERELVDKAIAMLNHSYVPYSKFPVGAALECADGTVFTGGGLAALGIAVIMHVIGKKSLLIFFFLAYFMSVSLSSLEINTVTYAIFGCICAGMYILFTAKEA